MPTTLERRVEARLQEAACAAGGPDPRAHRMPCLKTVGSSDPVATLRAADLLEPAGTHPGSRVRTSGHGVVRCGYVTTEGGTSCRPAATHALAWIFGMPHHGVYGGHGMGMAGVLAPGFLHQRAWGGSAVRGGTGE